MSAVLLAMPPAQQTRSVRVVRPAHSAPPVPARRGSLLIVEDDTSVRILLGRALAAEGITIAEAGTAEDAQQLASAHQPDVVIADVVMPGRSGIDLRRALTTLCPGVPVILISGYSPEQVAEFAARTPRTAFLPKPFAIAELQQMVNNALDGLPFRHAFPDDREP